MSKLALDAQDRPRSPGPGSLRYGRSIGRDLARLDSVLSDVLSVIDDEPWQMDANLDDAHGLIGGIRILVRQLNAPGALGYLRRQRTCHAFERACRGENDAYEVYAGNLECFRKRQWQNLGVAELDSDKHALMECRRKYVSALQACQKRVSGVLRLLP